MKIEAPPGLPGDRIAPEGLPEHWPGDVTCTRPLGDAWLEAGRTVMLEVPSALAPETRNTLLNPLHPDAVHVRITAATEHLLDPRLAGMTHRA